MKTHGESQTTFQKTSEILPLVLIAMGLAMEWLNFAFGELFLVVGFLLYGVFGVIISVKQKFYKGLSIRLFKFVNDIAIVLLSLALLSGMNTVFFLLLLIVHDRLILIPKVRR